MPIVLLLALVLVVAIGASSSKKAARATIPAKKRPSGLPLGNGYDIVPQAGSSLFQYKTPLGTAYPGIAGSAVIQADWAKEISKRFAARNKAIGFSGGPFASETTSREKWPFPSCNILSPNSPNQKLQCATILVDEFGRVWPGHYGKGSSDVLSGLNTFLKVASPALLAIPGWGPAAYIAVQVYLSQGKEASLKSAALAAARSQVPGGVAGQIAFDFGVGVVVEGQSPKEAGIQAAYNQMTPEQQAAFNYGMAEAKKHGFG